jgi:hypothetical protein
MCPGEEIVGESDELPAEQGADAPEGEKDNV